MTDMAHGETLTPVDNLDPECRAILNAIDYCQSHTELSQLLAIKFAKPGIPIGEWLARWYEHSFDNCPQAMYPADGVRNEECPKCKAASAERQQQERQQLRSMTWFKNSCKKVVRKSCALFKA